LHDHIISAQTTPASTNQARKRKHAECDTAPLLPAENTHCIDHTHTIAQAELEDINTCSQLHKKARLNNNSLSPALDMRTLLDDTPGLRGEPFVSFDLRDVT